MPSSFAARGSCSADIVRDLRCLTAQGVVERRGLVHGLRQH